jgi:hypothetical protein
MNLDPGHCLLPYRVLCRSRRILRVICTSFKGEKNDKGSRHLMSSRDQYRISSHQQGRKVTHSADCKDTVSVVSFLGSVLIITYHGGSLLRIALI